MNKRELAHWLPTARTAELERLQLEVSSATHSTHRDYINAELARRRHRESRRPPWYVVALMVIAAAGAAIAAWPVAAGWLSR